MAAVVVPVLPSREPPSFGRNCVSCGVAATTTSTLAIERLVTTANGRQESRGVRWPVPHCAACARLTTRTFLAALIPFAAGFLAVGGAAFAVVAYGAIVHGLDDLANLPAHGTPPSLVLGALAGLVGGIAGGFIAELAARVLLTPWFGAALWRMPMLVPSFFTDGDAVAGVSARPNADVSELTLTFDRDAAAGGFVAANPEARRVR